MRRLSPDLRKLFIKLDTLQRTSQEGLPALRDFLDGLAPVLDRLDPFLANLNPVIRYLEFQKHTVADFLAGPGSALSGATNGMPGDPAPRHLLRQISYLGLESASIHPSRLAINRGNGYLAAGALNNFSSASARDLRQLRLQEHRLHHRWSGRLTGCRRGGDPRRRDGSRPQQRQRSGRVYAPCYVQGEFPGGTFSDFGDGRFPQLFHDP